MWNHQLESNQPFGFDGINKGPKPSELLLAALAACQETTYLFYAEEMGIKTDKSAIKFTWTQDLQGFMSLEENIPVGFKNIEGEVHLDTQATNKELEELQILVDKHCPVFDGRLMRPVTVNLGIKKMDDSKSILTKNLF